MKAGNKCRYTFSWWQRREVGLNCILKHDSKGKSCRFLENWVLLHGSFVLFLHISPDDRGWSRVINDRLFQQSEWQLMQLLIKSTEYEIIADYEGIWHNEDSCRFPFATPLLWQSRAILILDLICWCTGKHTSLVLIDGSRNDSLIQNVERCQRYCFCRWEVTLVNKLTIFSHFVSCFFWYACQNVYDGRKKELS